MLNHSAFVNSYMKGAVRVVCPLLHIWPFTVRDGVESLKGSHTMGDSQIFLKNLCETSANFGLIYLAGQYLEAVNAHW